jgi:hypothetical protein
VFLFTYLRIFSHPLAVLTARAFSKLNPLKMANARDENREKTQNLRNQQSLLFLIESMMVIMKNKEI